MSPGPGVSKTDHLTTIRSLGSTICRRRGTKGRPFVSKTCEWWSVIGGWEWGSLFVKEGKTSFFKFDQTELESCQFNISWMWTTSFSDIWLCCVHYCDQVVDCGHISGRECFYLIVRSCFTDACSFSLNQLSPEDPLWSRAPITSTSFNALNLPRPIDQIKTGRNLRKRN